jgi:hypothetical protein
MMAAEWDDVAKQEESYDWEATREDCNAGLAESTLDTGSSMLEAHISRTSKS